MLSKEQALSNDKAVAAQQDVHTTQQEASKPPRVDLQYAMFSPKVMLAMQYTMGNQAVQRILANQPTTVPLRSVQRMVIQRTLAEDIEKQLMQESVSFQSLEELLVRVKAEPEKARKDVANNQYIIELAEQKLKGTDFPKFLHALQVYTDLDQSKLNGKATIQAAAMQVEDQFRKTLGIYVKEKIFNDVDITNNIMILPTNLFIKAALRYFPKTKFEDYDTISGFNVDGKVVIDANKTTDIGTLIHEAIHLYAQDVFVQNLGNDMNEGVTEYFARSIIRQLNLKIDRTKYQDQYRYASAFIAKIGEKIVAKAYFDGDIDSMKENFVGKKDDTFQESDPTPLETAWSKMNGETKFNKEEQKQALANNEIKPGINWDEQKTVLASNKMLSGEYLSEIEKLREIESYKNDIDRVEARTNTIIGVGLKAEPLVKTLWAQTNEVFTGKKYHNLEHIAEAMGDIERYFYSQTDKLFRMFQKNEAKAKIWADKLNTKLESIDPGSLIGTHLSKNTSIQKYNNKFEKAFEELPAPLQENKQEDTYDEGLGGLFD